MKEKIGILVRLQKIETESDQIRGMLDDIPDKIKTLELQLTEFQQKITEETDVVNELKKKYRACELDVKTNSSLVDKQKEKLLFVKTNKEYQAVLKGIEDIQVKNSHIEDEMLQYLDRIEEGEKVIAARQKQYSDLQKTIASEREKFKQEEDDGRKRLSKLEKEGINVSNLLDSELLNTYNMVQKRAYGIAVAGVTDAICGGCKMRIPPQLYNELHRFDSLRYCPHCQRIIYLEQQ